MKQEENTQLNTLEGLLPLAEYLEFIQLGKVPPLPPQNTAPDELFYYVCPESITDQTKVKRSINHDYNLWHIVDQRWTAALAKWIGNRRVLEIMAGSGWLAKALQAQSITVKPTDNFSSHGAKPSQCVTAVEPIEASQAVKKYASAHDVLLVCWPPYEMDHYLVEACQHWPSDKPIIYIGESNGGCNAGDAFWRHYTHEHLPVGLHCWQGRHDHVYSGFFYKNVD